MYWLSLTGVCSLLQVRFRGCYVITSRTRTWCLALANASIRSFTPCSCGTTRRWASQPGR